jgi:hypothetical protein
MISSTWINFANNMAAGLAPVHFFSHGSIMMLGEESEAADYWKKAGDQALANKIKGVVMMVCASSLLFTSTKSKAVLGRPLGRRR